MYTEMSTLGSAYGIPCPLSCPVQRQCRYAALAPYEKSVLSSWPSQPPYPSQAALFWHRATLTNYDKLAPHLITSLGKSQ